MLCDLIHMNRKMQGCQLINSLDNVLQFFSSEGSCKKDWLKDVSQKIESAQKVLPTKNCPAIHDTLSVEKMKDLNKQFFANEKMTIQV